MQALRRHDWVVYAKTPLGGPTAVLDYLVRYTHRTAIGNERLVASSQCQTAWRTVRAHQPRVAFVTGLLYRRRAAL